MVSSNTQLATDFSHCLLPRVCCPAHISRVSSHTLLDEMPDSPYLVGFHRQTLLSLTSQLFEALEISLGCAHWLFKPQMRVLHALLVGMPLQ